MAYVFISCTSDFSYLCSKKRAPCTYVWRHKGVKARRVDHVATRLPRMYKCTNRTHTTKKRQVKRTEMVATGRFTIHAFVTFWNC